jgi:hypothetical protein
MHPKRTLHIFKLARAAQLSAGAIQKPAQCAAARKVAFVFLKALTMLDVSALKTRQVSLVTETWGAQTKRRSALL